MENVENSRFGYLETRSLNQDPLANTFVDIRLHCGSRIAEQVQREVNDVDMDLFSVAYISCFLARYVLRAVRCDDCKTCLTSPVMF